MKPVRVQVAGQTLEFRPDQRGQARVGAASFRVRNANDSGVILGGLMEFELQVPTPEPASAQVVLAIDVGRAHHQTTLGAAGP